ncbi:alpha-amylase [Xylaria bambusicola]|uniref:alpha-amylase n=1 Tax=Xylaria bambusicola TaxID=326684 RepID=UPI0020077ECB|nr:alpha-amylase [Xylaria bambusicola]KAI0506854.1 alpha-amylase [Xylaria bambusicola]
MKAATFLAALAAGAQALSTNGWTKQSIYQVLTDRFARTDGSTSSCSNLRSYCGGTWQGLIKKLDYIQNMGFTAVWISPVVKNIEANTPYGLAYHGYWAQDIYSLNSHFGTEADLKALSKALHDRGMYLMVDIVVNHYAANSAPGNIDYSQFNPFNTADKFHSYCPIDYNNQNSIIKCWLGDTKVPLPDVKTEDSGVRDTFNGWIKDLVSTYGIDGLRIDTVQHVEKDFWPGFENAAGCYSVGEIFNGDPNLFPDWLKYISGAMNYPAYYWITRAFQSTSATMTDLLNGINTMKGLMATKTFGSFIENHDNPRFPALTSDMALDKNAIAFTMLMDGIPIIYQGQEQHFSGDEDPNNREPLWTSQYATNNALYPWIQKLNQIRNQAIFVGGDDYINYQAWPTSPDSKTIVLRKGLKGSQVVSSFTNVGANGGTHGVTLNSDYTGFTANQALTEVMSCTSVTTDGSGTLSFSQGPETKVFFPTAKLAGSGVCGGNSGGGGGGDGGGNGGGSGSCTSVPITFNEIVTTSLGETIKILGNIPALGSWSPSGAIALDASQYTSSNHLWRGTVNLPPGTTVQYKYIKVGSNGAVTWESDPNRSFTVPTACDSGVTRSDSWR